MVLPRVDLTFKTSLSSRKGFQTRILQIPPILAMIGCLILNLKKGEMLINQEKDQLVVSLVINMWVNALLELIIAMVVEKMVVW